MSVNLLVGGYDVTIGSEGRLKEVSTTEVIVEQGSISQSASQSSHCQLRDRDLDQRMVLSGISDGFQPSPHYLPLCHWKLNDSSMYFEDR